MNRRTFLTSSAAAAALWATPRARAAASLERVTLRFNWSWVGNYAPVIYGRELGFYRDVGIDLVPGQGKGSGATVRQGAAKNDMFVWADTSALLVGGAQGLPIKAVMVLAWSNLGFMWLEDKVTIRDAKDLKGKRISATPGDGNTQLWPAVLAANGLTAKDVDVVYLDATAAVAALRTARVDVAMCGVSDQPVTLRNAGFKAKAMTFAEAGIATLGSALITHRDVIAGQADLVRRMVAATQKSWAAGLKDPKAAVEAVMKITETPLNRNILHDSLLVFQKLATGTEPIGFVEPAAMERSLELLKKFGGVKTDSPATAYYTNEFLVPKRSA
jgi:NitT/TauT family transport system substrate-binding protein